MNPTIPTLAIQNLFTPPDPWSDSRNHGYQGPSRYVRLGRVAPNGTAAIAKSEDGVRCAVAGKESLRIVRVSPPGGHPSEHKSAVGPGGHRIDASRNFWDNSGLKVDSTSTDIAWGYGLFNNKILTSARNGELILWDVNKSGAVKYERRSKDHIRSINKLSVSHVVQYYCITGSADGDMRIWDLRDLTKSLMRVRHSTSIRSVVFSPSVWQPLQAIVGLDSGSIHRWDLKMGQRGGLDRLAVAHSAPVTTLDWCSSTANSNTNPTPNPDGSGNNLGWLVSGGLDKTVKVWDLTSPSANSHIPSKPTYVLHPSFPVRRVAWRPGYECELAVVSNDEMMVPNLDPPSAPVPTPGLLSRVGSGLGLDNMLKGLNSESLASLKERLNEHPSDTIRPPAQDADTLEIWDVRREWLPKWSVTRASADGGIADIAFADSHAVWAQYSSGTFSQLDLRESTRPILSINRVATTWDVAGSLTFIANKPSRWDPPYDDIHPKEKQRVIERKVAHVKALGDPPVKLKCQAFSTFMTEDAVDDLETFTLLARNYRFQGTNKEEICDTNAEIALQLGEERASQIWRVLGASLRTYGPPPPPSPPSPGQLPLDHSSAYNIPTAPTNFSFPSRGSTAPSEVSHHGSNKWSPSRKSSSQTSQVSGSHSRSPSGSRRLTPSSSNNTSPMHMSIGLPVTPARERAALYARRQSVDSGSAIRQSSAFRRPSLAVLQQSHSASPSDRALGSLRHVGEGALDDSSSSSDGQEETVGQRSDAEDPSAPRPMLSPNTLNKFPTPSPLSRIAGQQQWSDSEEITPKEGGDDETSSPSPRSTDTESDDSSMSRRVAKSRSSRRSSKVKSRSRSSTIASLAAPPRLIHQDSHSSIRTVIAADGHAKEREMEESKPPQQPEESHPTGGAYGHRRHRSQPIAGFIPEIESEPEEETPSPENQDSDKVTRRRPELVRSEEQRIREIALAALRKLLEDLLDEGDVQMSAMICLLARQELKLPDIKVVRIVESYLDRLMRLRLYTCAAFIRKHSNLEALQKKTLVETVVYTTCARCNKPIVRPAAPPLSGSRPAHGAFAYCLGCKKNTVYCSICHLPVRSLLFQCSVCNHGGHQACYRQYYMDTPMFELPTSFVPASDSEDRGRSLSRTVPERAVDESVETSVASTRSSVLGAPPGPSPVRTESVASLGHRMMGHPCATGCGHYCWAATLPVLALPSDVSQA